MHPLQVPPRRIKTLQIEPYLPELHPHHWVITITTSDKKPISGVLSADGRKKFLGRLAATINLSKIGRLLSITRERARQLVTEAGVDIRIACNGLDRAEKHKEEIKKCLDEGLSCAKIAKATGIPLYRVREVARINGWKMKPVYYSNGTLLESWIGARIGDWFILGISDKRSTAGRPYLHCRCLCGTEREVMSENLFNNQTRSCGCMRSAKRVIAKLNRVVPSGLSTETDIAF